MNVGTPRTRHAPMATVSGTGSGTAATNSVIDALNATIASAQSAASVQRHRDRFLKLLVAQMNNQDPLNPMDNAAVTSQLAQINTVRGIEQMNTTLSKFVASPDQRPGDRFGLADRAQRAGRRQRHHPHRRPDRHHRIGASLSGPMRQADARGARWQRNAVRTSTWGKQTAGVVTAVERPACQRHGGGRRRLHAARDRAGCRRQDDRRDAAGRHAGDRRDQAGDTRGSRWPAAAACCRPTCAASSSPDRTTTGTKTGTNARH